MGLIRQSALLQMPTNNNGLVTASNAREVFGVVEDCLNDAVLDLTTLINNIQIGTAAVGNIYEVQMKGNNNTLLSSSNFTYNNIDDKFLIKNSSFNVSNSISTFLLPALNENSFIISSDDSFTNNFVDINAGANTISIGALESAVSLKRGPSTLDESLTLTADLLSLQNSNFFIKSPSATVGNALEVRNSANQNLISYQNDGRMTRVISYNSVDNDYTVDYGDYTRVNFTFSGSGGARDVTGSGIETYITNNTSNPVSRYVGQYVRVIETGPDHPAYHKVGLWCELSGGGNGTAAYFSNCVSIGKLPVYYNSPTSDNRGFVGMKATSDNLGIDINYEPSFGGMKTLLRLARDSSIPTPNMLGVNDGLQIKFRNNISRVINSPNAGMNDTATIDYLGVRVKDTTQFLPTTEMFFKTTQSGVSVEPLKISGQYLIAEDLPIAADNAAALLIPLTVNTFYKTATGELRIVV